MYCLTFSGFKKRFENFMCTQSKASLTKQVSFYLKWKAEKSQSHEDVVPRLMLTNPLLKCCPLEVKVEFTQMTFKL